ncbi:MAG: hypothetical protein JRN15_23395 [Nitrososphaerota archaeon]|nr:hypothetical protein [Nitrososphaerota archaeon]
MSEGLPKWVAEEIKTAKFGKPEEWEGSGYILEANKEQQKVDVQFYEKLPEGRYIATLELPDKFNADSLELGLVYLFKFNTFKAVLPEKVTKFLKEKFDLVMDSIYRFELVSAERLEAEADNVPRPTAEEEDE